MASALPAAPDDAVERIGRLRGGPGHRRDAHRRPASAPVVDERRLRRGSAAAVDRHRAWSERVAALRDDRVVRRSRRRVRRVAGRRDRRRSAVSMGRPGSVGRTDADRRPTTRSWTSSSAERDAIARLVERPRGGCRRTSNEVYVDDARPAGRRSPSGAFTPDAIEETWDGDGGPVTVAFAQGGAAQTLHPAYLEDWIDPRILAPINGLIAEPGDGSSSYRAFDQTAFVMALTETERAALEASRVVLRVRPREPRVARRACRPSPRIENAPADARGVRPCRGSGRYGAATTCSRRASCLRRGLGGRLRLGRLLRPRPSAVALAAALAARPSSAALVGFGGGLGRGRRGGARLGGGLRRRRPRRGPSCSARRAPCRPRSGRPWPCRPCRRRCGPWRPWPRRPCRSAW